MARIGRPVSTKYERRVKAVRGVTEWLRNEARKDLEEGLRESTKIELYDRTPLEVSHDLFNSIGSRIKGQMVEVGYNMARGYNLVYTGFRLNMKGISVLGGHVLDMAPSKYIKKYVDPKIRRRNTRAHKGIIGD